MSPSSYIDTLHPLLQRLTAPQLTFLASFSLYPCVFYLSLPSRDRLTRLRFAQSREAISIFHSMLLTGLSLYCLHANRDAIFPSPRPADSPSQQSTTGGVSKSPDQQQKYQQAVSSSHNPHPDLALPIITRRSTFASCLTALETAYLLQDSLLLIHAARLHTFPVGTSFITSSSSSSSSKANPKSTIHPLSNRGLPLTHFAIHHGVLLSLLAPLQHYIHTSRDVGTLLVVAMFLMSASTPLGTLRWFLRLRREASRSSSNSSRSTLSLLLRLTTAGYLVTFGACRVGLFYALLRVFGAQKTPTPLGPLAAYWRLRWQCRVGTGAMLAVNTAWWLVGLRNFLASEIRLLLTTSGGRRGGGRGGGGGEKVTGTGRGMGRKTL